MRNKRALANIISNIVLQIVVSATGLILPRLLILEYGSEINGMISSISQFITWMGLVEAGISSAAAVALYKPIADGNQKKINQILSGVKRFYIRSGLLYLGLLAVLVVCYPIWVTTDLDAQVMRVLIVILGGTGIVDYFLLGKYKVFLIAAQKTYVTLWPQTTCTVLSTVLSVVLIYSHASVLWVKGVVVLAYLLRFAYIYLYVRKKEPWLGFKEQPDTEAFSFRRDVLIHQLCGMVVVNSAVIVMTVMLGSGALREISVYSVYNMVGYTLYSFLNIFFTGLCAGIGDVIARDEKEKLREVFSQFEYIFYILVFVVYLCMSRLLLPFIGVYTGGVTDVNYFRPASALLFTLAGFFQTIRIPGLTVICAAGHYRQTRSRAVAEMLISIVLSLALVRPLGMNGVLIGALASFLYRDVDIFIYTPKYLVPKTGVTTAKRLARNAVTFIALYVLTQWIIPDRMKGLSEWLLYAIALFVGAAVAFVAVNYIFEPQMFKSAIVRIKETLGRKKA